LEDVGIQTCLALLQQYQQLTPRHGMKKRMEMIKPTSSFATVIVPKANMLSRTARMTCFCLIKMLIFGDLGLVAHLRATVNTADQCMLEYFMFYLQILSYD
jgi:hypothetical protein